MKAIMHNPLDHILDNNCGKDITAASLLLEHPNFKDTEEIEVYLKDYVQRHSKKCQVIHYSPYMINIYSIPHDIDVYNKNMHRKHQEARRVMR